MKNLTIHLGKGVVLTAPVKLDMSYDEWVRMRDYIDSLLDNRFLSQQYTRGERK